MPDIFLLHCSVTEQAYKMVRNLMAPQDLKELGFQEDGSQKIPEPSAKAPQQQTGETDWQERKQRGFTAGIRR